MVMRDKNRRDDEAAAQQRNIDTARTWATDARTRTPPIWGTSFCFRSAHVTVAHHCYQNLESAQASRKLNLGGNHDAARTCDGPPN